MLKLSEEIIKHWEDTSHQNTDNHMEFELKKKVANTIKRLYDYNQSTIDLEQPLEVMGVEMTLDYWQFDLIVEYMSIAISRENHKDVSEEIHQYVGFDYDVEATEDFVNCLFDKYFDNVLRI